MNVAYILTRNFYEKAVPSMRSVLAHNPKARIYLLGEDDEADLGVPLTMVNVSGQNWFTEKSCVNIKNNFGGYINLLKVCYPALLPRLKKVIHLDADAIVNDSLEEMWKTDLSGKWFGAVREDRGRYHPFGPVYYNAGVMVINLEQMRRDNIMPEMVDYLCSVKQPFADQDAWNYYAIHDDKAVTLPVRYNENFATGYTGNPAIVHYCGVTNWWDDRRMWRREYLDRYKN